MSLIDKEIPDLEEAASKEQALEEQALEEQISKEKNKGKGTSEKKPRKKGFFKRLFRVFLFALVAFVIVRFGPGLLAPVIPKPGSIDRRAIAAQSSEELQKLGKLVVLHRELSYEETWRVSAFPRLDLRIPYTYTADFTVDLKQSSVRNVDDTFEIRMPKPALTFHKMEVNERDTEKVGWAWIAYTLSEEEYATIKKTIEENLTLESASNPSNLRDAWASAVEYLEDFLKAFIQVSPISENPDQNAPEFKLVFIMDDSVSKPSVTSDPAEPAATDSSISSEAAEPQ